MCCTIAILIRKCFYSLVDCFLNYSYNDFVYFGFVCLDLVCLSSNSNSNFDSDSNSNFDSDSNSLSLCLVDC